MMVSDTHRIDVLTNADFTNKKNMYSNISEKNQLFIIGKSFVSEDNTLSTFLG